jgi:DNA-binding transcriptional MerR regulator
MPLKKDKNLKIYFSIAEVAEMFKLNPATLRFWEKKFDTLRPKTNDSGTRFYKQEDIETIQLIHYMLKVRKFTIAGALIQLKTNRENIRRQAEIATSLQNIKEELISLRSAFETIDPEKE